MSATGKAGSSGLAKPWKKARVGDRLVELYPSESAFGLWQVDRVFEARVDGILRAYVGYDRSHRRGTKPQWRVYSLQPELVHQGTQGGHRSFAQVSVPGSTVEEKMAWLPDRADRGILPTKEEVVVRLQEADEANAAREAERKAWHSALKEREAAALAAEIELADTLLAIRDRLSVELTNYEVDALLRAAAIIVPGRDEPPDDDLAHGDSRTIRCR